MASSYSKASPADVYICSAAWLPSVISWVTYQAEDTEHSDVYEEEEVGISFDKLKALYAHANEALRGGSKVRLFDCTCACTHEQSSGEQQLSYRQVLGSSDRLPLLMLLLSTF